MKSDKWLCLERTVKFGECDSAGVVHFHNLFSWAHESWEESINVYGISHHDIFPSEFNQSDTILPIINCEAKFFAPIQFGCVLNIVIKPVKINNHLFKIETLFFNKSVKSAKVIIIHCSINSKTKEKTDLPHSLELWIESSNLGKNIQEC